MDAIEEYEVDGLVVKILPDDGDDNNPRDWDNLGTMICFHKRYDLGDKHDYHSYDYSSWEEVREDIIKRENPEVVLALYLYDHSGISMSCSHTYPYNDIWDAGQVGFIFISKEKVREEYSAKRISKKLHDQVEKYLISEVEIYDQYLRGEVYGFIVEDQEGNHLDSCWGFLGDIEDCKKEAEESAHWQAKEIIIEAETWII